MTIPEFLDKVAEYVETHEPHFPELGKYKIDSILETLPERERPLSFHFDLALMEMNDSRFETGFGWVRLRKSAPWPSELQYMTQLDILVAMYERKLQNCPESSCQELANMLALKTVTIQQHLFCLARYEKDVVERVDTKTYRLLLSQDRDIYVYGNKRKSAYLTTLAKEVERRQAIGYKYGSFVNVPSSDSTIQAIDNTLADIDTSIHHLEEVLEAYRKVERELRNIRNQLKPPDS